MYLSSAVWPTRDEEPPRVEDYLATRNESARRNVSFKAPPKAAKVPPAGKAGYQAAPPKKAAPAALSSQRPSGSAAHPPLTSLAPPPVPKTLPETRPAGPKATGNLALTAPAPPVSAPEGLQLSLPSAERAAPVVASAELQQRFAERMNAAEYDMQRMACDLADYRTAVDKIFYQLNYNFGAENALALFPDGGGRVSSFLNAKQTHNTMTWFIRNADQITNADGSPAVIRISCYTYDVPQVHEAILHARNFLGKEIYMCVDYREVLGKHTREMKTCIIALKSAGVRVHVVAGQDIQVEYGLIGRQVRPGKGILHQKAVMVGPWVIMGSANLTTASRCNHELGTLLYLDDVTRGIYVDQFHALMEQGELLTDEIIRVSEEKIEAKRQQEESDSRRGRSSRSSASSSLM